jgi:hypothetical protein
MRNFIPSHPTQKIHFSDSKGCDKHDEKERMNENSK